MSKVPWGSWKGSKSCHNSKYESQGKKGKRLQENINARLFSHF
jgi:hypothetical protein